MHAAPRESLPLGANRPHCNIASDQGVSPAAYPGNPIHILDSAADQVDEETGVTTCIAYALCYMRAGIFVDNEDDV